MEASASAPVLRSEDYFVPANGIGKTGHANRTCQGPFSRDKGTHSSRINQIVKQAQKVPGPGKYGGHDDWKNNGGNTFAKLERSYKQMNKVPAPHEHEQKFWTTGTKDKEFMNNHINGAKDNLSHIPRITQGRIAKGKKRSFLDQAIAHSATCPGPGHVTPLPKFCNRPDLQVKGATDWRREATVTKSLAVPEKSIGPDHYNLNHNQVTDRLPLYSVPRESGKNFVDKAVKDKCLDGAAGKRYIPGPGTYSTHELDINKTSRGTFLLQLRGLTRSPMSGYL